MRLSTRENTSRGRQAKLTSNNTEKLLLEGFCFDKLERAEQRMVVTNRFRALSTWRDLMIKEPELSKLYSYSQQI